MNTDEKGRIRSADEACEVIDTLTERVIAAAFRVSNVLGAGFLEKVYENALAHELRKSGIDARQQVPVTVLYDEVVVGEYVADLLVEQKVLVELKAARGIDPIHEAQLLNYLKATGTRVGLILNFGTPRVGIRRLVR
jgi:GxxExxY protein